MASVQSIQRVLDSRARDPNAKTSSVAIVGAASSVASAEVQRQFAEQSRRHSKLMGHLVLVLEQQGFAASALLAAMTRIIMPVVTRRTTSIARTLAEAAEMLIEPHAQQTGVTLNARDLQSALEIVRQAPPAIAKLG